MSWLASKVSRYLSILCLWGGRTDGRTDGRTCSADVLSLQTVGHERVEAGRPAGDQLPVQRRLAGAQRLRKLAVAKHVELGTERVQSVDRLEVAEPVGHVVLVADE